MRASCLPRSPAALAVAGALLWLLSLAPGCGGGVKYPQCETDDQCKTDGSGNAVTEYCVNKQCQECRDDSHCDAGQACKSGRCQAKSECPCQAPLICQGTKCVQPECASNEDCAAGKKCDAGFCVEAGCTSDQECGGGMVCKDGACAAASDKVSSECRPGGDGEVVALQTVQFDFDKSDLTPPTRSALEQNAECMRQAPDLKVVLEGHADERGTQEYNLALGDKRANTVKDYLKNLGIEAGRMRTLSKGKNEPVCDQATDSCFAKNRRVNFLQKR